MLDTEECEKQVEGALFKEQPKGLTEPVGYWSRSCNKAGRAYDTARRTCLFVVWGTLLFRPFLEGSWFTIRSDQDALPWKMSIKDATGKQMRWCI